MIPKINKLLMQLLNLEAIFDKMLNQILKKFYKFAITLEMKKWLNSKSKYKINK
jgi:hypothetical protein